MLKKKPNTACFIFSHKLNYCPIIKILISKCLLDAWTRWLKNYRIWSTLLWINSLYLLGNWCLCTAVCSTVYVPISCTVYVPVIITDYVPIFSKVYVPIYLGLFMYLSVVQFMYLSLVQFMYLSAVQTASFMLLLDQAMAVILAAPSWTSWIFFKYLNCILD